MSSAGGGSALVRLQGTSADRRHRIDLIDLALRSWTGLVAIFLLAPIGTVALFAFNRGVAGKQTAVFTGFTTHWFAAAWGDPALRHSLWVSFRVAVPLALLAVALGTTVGVTLARHPWRPLRVALELLTYFLLIVPEIVLAVSLLVFFTRSGLGLGYGALVAGHSPFALAVVALVVRSRVVALESTLEDAAADLGARPWQQVRDVMIPQLLPAMVTSLILAFTFSFDDLIISELLATPTVSTLPVYIFGEAHAGMTPDVYAIAALMLGVTAVALLSAGGAWRYFARRGREATPLAYTLTAHGAGDRAALSRKFTR